MRRVNPNASDKMFFSLIIKIHASLWGDWFQQYYVLENRPLGLTAGKLPCNIPLVIPSCQGFYSMKSKQTLVKGIIRPWKTAAQVNAKPIPNHQPIFISMLTASQQGLMWYWLQLSRIRDSWGCKWLLEVILSIESLLKQAVQDHIQVILPRMESLQPSRQTVLALGHPHAKESLYSDRTSCASICASCPVTGYHWNESGSVFSAPSLQTFIYINETLLKYFLWFNSPSFPAFPHESFNHLSGPRLPHKIMDLGAELSRLELPTRFHKQQLPLRRNPLLDKHKNKAGHHLLDGLDNLKLRGCVEVVAFLPEIETQEAGDIPASDVNPHDGVRHGKAFIDGNRVGDAIPRVQHHSRGPAGRVATKGTKTHIRTSTSKWAQASSTSMLNSGSRHFTQTGPSKFCLQFSKFPGNSLLHKLSFSSCMKRREFRHQWRLPQHSTNTNQRQKTLTG